MAYGILLVDDQRDILRLLHSTLDTLKNQDLEVYEAPSGEEAMLAVGQHRIDLLVTDYLLPGITGIELMHKVRVKHPDVRVVLITGMTDRKARDEMLNAGAIAIFDKPVPLADFLDVVERSLGLVRTIFPPESDAKTQAKRSRISDLLANFRQDIKAQAVFLLNDRGLVMARAGDLRDSSMEVSLFSAMNAIFSAGRKIAKFNRQESLDQYFIFSGGDHDLLLLPIDVSYTLLVAGDGLAKRENVLDSLEAMLAVRNEVGRSLRSMGVTSELKEPPTSPAPSPAPEPKKKRKTSDLPAAPPAPEMETLLKEATKKKTKQEEVDAFWNQAAEQHANKSTNPEVISYEEARKMGLAPDHKK
jgi:CheY-like chemotaxis protein